MTHTVVGIFNDADDAKNAVDQLANNGFDRSNIDYSRGSSSGYNTNDENADDNESGIGRFFKNLFSSKDESDRYARAARNGSVVTVHAQSSEEAQRASELLDNYGAIDVDEKDRGYGTQNNDTNSDYSDRLKMNADTIGAGTMSADTMGTGTMNTGTMGAGAMGANTMNEDSTYNTQSGSSMEDSSFNEENRKIPVVEENLEVGKRVVETGGVRLRSRIIEKPVEETIRLREEHVNVERTQVNREATDADFNNFKDETIEVREHGEVPVVNKSARVVEEVSVNKTVDQREETVRDKVRSREVDVEDVDTNKRRNDL